MRSRPHIEQPDALLDETLRLALDDTQRFIDRAERTEGGNPMPATMRTRSRSAIVAIAPAALLAALVTHPFLPGRLPNDAAVAAAVAADTIRWGLVHLATGVASGLVILAFLAIRSYLRDAGEERFSAVGFPFIVIGSTLFTLLTGLEFAPLAAAEMGAGLADIAATQAALAPSEPVKLLETRSSRNY